MKTIRHIENVIRAFRKAACRRSKPTEIHIHPRLKYLLRGQRKIKGCRIIFNNQCPLNSFYCI